MFWYADRFACSSRQLLADLLFRQFKQVRWLKKLLISFNTDQYRDRLIIYKYIFWSIFKLIQAFLSLCS